MAERLNRRQLHNLRVIYEEQQRGAVRVFAWRIHGNSVNSLVKKGLLQRLPKDSGRDTEYVRLTAAGLTAVLNASR